MGQFSIHTNPWLRSLIRQRRMLMRINKSHKDRITEELALERLERQLGAYSYDNDLYMSRFIRCFSADIEIILPGKGSSCHAKRLLEWDEIKKRSILIEEKFTKKRVYEKVF